MGFYLFFGFIGGMVLQAIFGETSFILSGMLVAAMFYFKDELEHLKQKSASSQRLRLRKKGYVHARVAPSVPPTQTARTSHAIPNDPTSKSMSATMRPLFQPILHYLSGGNPLVRIGAIVLFLGMAFLAKYAVEHSLISIQLRLITIGIIAVALIATGWKLRTREGQYGLIIQGIGIAMLYLIIYTSAKLYGFIPLEIAFILMLAVAVFAAMLAIFQNALPLMLFATTGGFFVPILTSSGEGSHVLLFSYYALLNLGIVIVGWYRSWRLLNVTGFLFTFIIATLWGVLRYEPSHFLTTEPFLILFFLFYLTITIVFTYRQSYNLKGFIDATLVFGVPLVSFSLQAMLVQEIAHAMAYSAFLLALLYAALSRWLWNQTHMRLLAESFLALSLLFATIAIPYTLNASWSAVTWALEASAILWISLRQHRLYPRHFAIALYLLASMTFGLSLHDSNLEVAFFNGAFFGGILFAVSALCMAWLYQHYHATLEEMEHFNSSLFVFFGIGWLLITGAQNITVCCDVFAYGMLIYLAVIASLLAIASHYLTWTVLQKVLQGYFGLGMLYYLLLIPYFVTHHPFDTIGALAFILFFGVHYLLLYRFESLWETRQPWHIIGALTLLFIASWELAWQIHTATHHTSFTHIGWVILPLLAIMTVLKFPHMMPWPLQHHRLLYQQQIVGSLLLGLFAWNGYSIGFDARLYDGVYLPFINPLELFQIGVLLLSRYWWDRYSDALTPLSHLKLEIHSALGLFGLLLLSTILARSFHFYLEVPYQLPALWNNVGFQMALSLLWSITAFGTIFLARLKQKRFLWFTGAVLLGMVITKLFIIDLSNSATIERIISFSVVGVLVLFIGYFAPLPPKNDTPPQTT